MIKAILILVIVVGIITAVFVFKKKSAIAPGPTESPTINENVSSNPNTTSISQTVTIIFANGTATPNLVTIKTGDMVKFVNNDSVPRWPAAGTHPIHQTCLGFDALRGLATGESYSFQFNEAKTCPWHDHLKPSINGQITVTQ